MAGDGGNIAEANLCKHIKKFEAYIKELEGLVHKYMPEADSYFGTTIDELIERNKAKAMTYDRDMLLKCSNCDKDAPAPDIRRWGQCQECKDSMTTDQQMGEMVSGRSIKQLTMDRTHAMVTIQSAEMAVDALAIRLKNEVGKDAKLINILGLLHKASSHLYCAHATMLETPKTWTVNA